MPIETDRPGADREAAWASEGLRAAFADLMTKRVHLRERKTQPDARAMQKNRAVCEREKGKVER